MNFCSSSVDFLATAPDQKNFLKKKALPIAERVIPRGTSQRHTPAAHPRGTSQRHIPAAHPSGTSQRHNSNIISRETERSKVSGAVGGTNEATRERDKIDI